MLTNVLSVLQHNEVKDIQSKPTFVSCGHHLLFVFLLICLFAYLLAILLVCLIACLLASLFLCLSCLSCLSTLCLFHELFTSFFFPLLVFWFLVFTFACTHMEWGRMELGYDLSGARKKGAKMQAYRYKPSGYV